MNVNGSARAIVVAICLATAAASVATAEGLVEAEEDAFRAAVARVANAVVRIEPPLTSTAAVAAEREADLSVGPSTGVIVDPAGLVLAAALAVPADAGDTVVVLPDGRRAAGRPLGRDLGRGIVLLETTPIPEAPPLDVVPRGSLEPGQWTVAVGRGWAADQPGVSVGILSAIDRAWGLAVQTDAAVSPMNYGGPLLDIAGRVIGIVAPLPAEPASMMRGTELYDAGIGFAVPLEDILAILPRLRQGEVLQAGLLGITYRDRDTINGEPVIASVRQGSPAARAGLRPGDRIMSVDGRTVRRIADARHAIAPRHAGDTVAIEVERGAGESPATVAASATLAAALPPWRRSILGLLVADQDATDDAASPRIEWVLPGGPADTAGVAAGARVTAIVPPGTEVPVPSPTASALAGVVAGLEAGDTVRLVLDRAGAISSADVRLTEMIRTVPAEGPGGDAVAIDGAADAARVVRVKAVDLADPPVAVVPAGSTPAPLLVWCGPPHGRSDESEATVWKAAAAAAGVVVLLPGSSATREWTENDIETVIRGMQAVAGERAIDPRRLAVAGRGAGGTFAWLVAAALGDACGGIATFEAEMPRRVLLGDATPGTAKWILLGAGDVADRDASRVWLEKAGHVVGDVPAIGDSGPPAAVLCRWATLLGLL